MMKRTESIPRMALWLLIPLALIVALCFSCEPAHAQIEPGPIEKPTPIIAVKPTPIPEPTPATKEDWSAVIEESPTAQKFVTVKKVVQVGDVAQYPVERVVQDPLSASAVKGVKWVKTYILWTRGDGTVILLSQGWTAETILDAPTSVVVTPKVEVFK